MTDTPVMVTRRGTAYEVTRTFNSLPAAMAGVAALGDIHESAYAPQLGRELPPHVEALIERCDEDAPTAHLKAGEAHEHDREAYERATAAQRDTGE